MRRLILAAIAVLSTALLSPQAWSQKDEVERYQAEDAPVKLFDLFSGELQLLERDDGVRVEVRNWSIAGGTRLEDLPLRSAGLLIVQLRGGELTTIIGDEKRERREGEYWTVPSGMAMGLVTTDDAAIIQIVVVGAD
jgi:quercetin dioxygenase-like cupin family protein